MIRTYQRLLNGVHIGLDLFGILISLWLAWEIKFRSGLFAYGGHYPLSTYLVQLWYLVPLFLFVYGLFNLYTPRRTEWLLPELGDLLKANGVAALAAMSILFFTKNVNFSREVLGLFAALDWAIGSLFRLTLRLSLRAIRQGGFNQKHLLVIGAGALGVRFAGRALENRHFGYRILGFLDDDRRGEVGGLPVLGGLARLEEILSTHQVDQVVIALPISATETAGQLLAVTEEYGVPTAIIPDYFDYLPARPRVDDFDGIPLIDVRHVPLNELGNRLLKRTIDLIAAAVLVVVLSPVLLVVAILVKLSSPGPVLFVQERMGLNRRAFRMYKFRTMRVNSEAEATWTKENDPRRTRIGTFLRATSLDELPQLWNVLLGQMSLVGPRPEQPRYAEAFRQEIPKYMVKHQVRPGMTGWAQVHGWRGDTSIEERIRFDLYYVENWSIWLDLRILGLTVVKGLRDKNAY